MLLESKKLLIPGLSVAFSKMPKEKWKDVNELKLVGTENFRAKTIDIMNCIGNSYSLCYSGDPVDYLSLCIQFTDNHRICYSTNNFPSSKLVQDNIDYLLNLNRQFTLVDQIKFALKESNDGLIDASKLCMLSSRIMARNMDTRIYPDVKIDKTDMLKWRQKMAVSFNCADQSGANYYFFTGLSVSTLLSFTGGQNTKEILLEGLFKRGSTVMKLARKYLAGQPTMSNFDGPYRIGWQIGKYLFDSKVNDY